MKNLLFGLICLNIVVLPLHANDTSNFNDDAEYTLDTIISSITKNKIIPRFPPYFNKETNRYHLRNEDAFFRKKILRGSMLMLSYNSMITSLLLILPEDVSKWKKSNYSNQFKSAYTNLPVFDRDKWYINYLGHPYQGTIYYNAMRSQGAEVWQSSLFCIGSVWIWEYTIEAGFEQPSIQDLIVTPSAGIVLGELINFSTIKMSNNGFKWYEKMFVSILNPSFAVNNGFKYAANKYQVKYRF